MGDEQALRERLAAMETAALLEAWTHEERLPWAEALLADALAGRGLSEDVLQQLKQRRGSADAPARPDDGAGRGEALFIWAAAGMLAMALSAVVGALGALVDREADLMAALAVMLVPVESAGRGLWRQWRRPRDAVRTLALLYRGASLAQFALLLVGTLVGMSLGRMDGWTRRPPWGRIRFQMQQPPSLVSNTRLLPRVPHT